MKGHFYSSTFKCYLLWALCLFYNISLQNIVDADRLLCCHGNLLVYCGNVGSKSGPITSVYSSFSLKISVSVT